MSFNLPYPDGSFDVVLTSFMLHHLEREDKLRTSVEMYRVLRTGGRLVGVDVCEWKGLAGNALKLLVRNFERVADNLDGYLPVMINKAGFKNYSECHHYLFNSIALFKASKN